MADGPWKNIINTDDREIKRRRRKWKKGDHSSFRVMSCGEKTGREQIDHWNRYRRYVCVNVCAFWWRYTNEHRGIPSIVFFFFIVLPFFFLFFFSLCVSTHEFGLGILRTHSLLSLSGSFWWLKNPSRSRIVGNVGLMGGMAAWARRRRGSKEEKMKKPNGYVYRRLRRYFSLFFSLWRCKTWFSKGRAA